MANPNPEVPASPRAYPFCLERRGWARPIHRPGDGSASADHFDPRSMFVGSSP